jgi:hypothetical protein
MNSFDLLQYRKYIDFKDDKEAYLLGYLSPWLWIILADTSLWCMQNNVPLQITRSFDGRIPGISMSDTHLGRAVDMSVHGWPSDKILEYEKVFEAKYEFIAAVAKNSGKPNLVEYHIGTAPHIHLQIRKDWAVFSPKISKY